MKRLKDSYGSEDQTSLIRIKCCTYGEARGENLSYVVQGGWCTKERKVNFSKQNTSTAEKKLQEKI